MSNLKKQAEKLLKAIEFEPAPLSINNGNRGVYIRTKFSRWTRKDKLHDGRYYPRLIKPQVKYSEIASEALGPKEEYNDWNNWRDGQRDLWNKDKIYKLGFKRSGWRKEVYDEVKQLNAKLKKHEYIRRQMRAKERMRNGLSGHDRYIQIRRK